MTRLSLLAGPALVLLFAAPAAAQDHLTTPGALEGRPDVRAVSPLQVRIDAAAPGARIDIPAGTYVGDLVIEAPVTLVGRGRPLLLGSGSGSVIRVRADDVTIEGLDIDGRRGGDLGRDSSGIHVTGARVRVRSCHIRNALFGIYLREAHGAVVEGNTVQGIPGVAPGEKGSGIHVWNTEGFRLVGNTVSQSRDGFYIQSSPHGYVARNTARDLRYGLHYMFSDDNVFEDNVFANGAAGTALMYSKRITFRRNQFLHNRGFASVGLLFKSCDDVLAEDNFIGDNARGIFVEGAVRSRFRRNVIAESDTAIVLYDSNAGVHFDGNLFTANLTPLTLVGRRTDTVFTGNYWSDHDSPDLDGDGFADQPYRLSSLFDHLRGNLMAADLFTRGVAAAALAAAERSFPVLSPATVVDAHALARPPSLPDVPIPGTRSRSIHPLGLAVSGASLMLGLVAAWRGRRPPVRRPV